MQRLSELKIILFSSTFFILFYNFSFFKNVINTYGFNGLNIIYVLSTAILLIALITFILTLFSSKYTIKPILYLLFLVSAFTAYFMDTYSVVIDSEMIRNMLQTNLGESLDLFTLKLVLYVLFLGILPIFFIYKSQIVYKPLKSELFSKLKTIILSIILISIILFSFSKFYTSFFREHKPLRYNINPIYWIYSVGNFVHKTLDVAPKEMTEIGKDSKVVEPANIAKELVILVVGEAARADRFSINGYEKETNPLLKKKIL